MGKAVRRMVRRIVRGDGEYGGEAPVGAADPEAFEFGAAGEGIGDEIRGQEGRGDVAGDWDGDVRRETPGFFGGEVIENGVQGPSARETDFCHWKYSSLLR